MIDFLKMSGAALIGLGFIYFVILRLFRVNYYKKALIALIVGIVETILIVIAMLSEYGFVPINIKTLWYYSFLIISVVLMISIPLTCFVLGKKNNQRFRNVHYKYAKVKVENVKPTIKDKEEYIYYVFKCKDNFLLKEVIKDKELFYRGEVEKLKKILFHDEMANHLIEKYNLNDIDSDNVISARVIGEALVKGKVDKHYYCYVIEINEITDSLKDFKGVSAYELFKYNLEDFDKKIMFHIILREPFKLEF